MDRVSRCWAWLAVASVLCVSLGLGCAPSDRGSTADARLADSLRAMGPAYEAWWNDRFTGWLEHRLAGDSTRADSAQAFLRRLPELAPSTWDSLTIVDALQRAPSWSLGTMQKFHEAALAEREGRSDSSRDPAASFAKAATIYNGLGELRREAVVLGLQATRLVGNPEGARVVLRAALGRRIELGDPRLLANTYNELGRNLAAADSAEAARACLQAAIDIRIANGLLVPAARARANLAGLLGRRGQLDSAVVLMSEARAVIDSLQDGAAYRREVLELQVGMLADSARWNDILRITEQDLADPPDQKMELALRIARSNALQSIGRYDEASRALQIGVERLSDPGARLQALIEIGRLRVNIPDPRAAVAPLREAIRLADSLGDQASLAAASNDLAIARIQAHEFGADTESLLTRAEAAAEALRDMSLLRDVHLTFGDLARKRHEYHRAAESYRQSTRDAPPEDLRQQVGDLINLGVADIFDGRFRAAERKLKVALAQSRESRLGDQIWRAQLCLGDIAERRGDVTGALRAYRTTADLIDSLRALQHPGGGVTFFADRFEVHEAAIHLLTTVDGRRPQGTGAAAAFEWAERGRALALGDLQALRGVVPRAAKAPDLVEVQSRLANDEAVLEYSLGDTSSTMWVIRPRQWRHVRLATRSEISKRVNAILDSLGSYPSADLPRTRTLLREAYDAFVAPGDSLLAGVRRVWIVPDGALAFLPFEALLAPPSGVRSEPEYLVLKWVIGYLPSARMLLDESVRARGQGIVALADPELGPMRLARGDRVVTLQPLPGSRAEVDTLRRIFGRTVRTTLLGRQATLPALLQSVSTAAPEFLHIGTHGDVDAATTEQTGLWFSETKRHTGRRVTAKEILEAPRLRADVVVLSACRSGAGRLERGEGVMGLPRAFLANGSRKVVVSQWNVNDSKTASLFGRFYRLTRDRNRSPEEALTLAKRELLTQTTARSPYFWAPFVMVSGPVGRR